MNSCNNIIDSMCRAFSENCNLADVKFIHEFPSAKQDMPLREPIVSIGMESILIANDDKVTIKTGVSSCEVEILLNVCVPKAESGFNCQRIVDRIIEGIECFLDVFSIIGIVVEKTKYSTSLNALVVPIKILISNDNAY